MLTGIPLVVISIKEFDVMAHLEDKWPWASAEVFPGWATLTLCYPFQVDNYSNANGRSQNALPSLHHKENALCYGNSHKKRASFAAMLLFMLLFTWFKTTWLTIICSHLHYLPKMPAFNIMNQQSLAVKRLLPQLEMNL